MSDKVVELSNPTSWQFMTWYRKTHKKLEENEQRINSENLDDEDREMLLKEIREMRGELENMRQRVMTN